MNSNEGSKKGIKEYQMRQDQFKRPVLIVKDNHDVQHVHDISKSYDSPNIIADLLQELFDVAHLAEEYVWMFCLTSANRINGVFEISHGTVDNSFFRPREILQKALLSGAVKIVIAHCHPSGHPDPSDTDITVTKRLYDSCKLLGVPLLDHVIVGCNEEKDYYSFAEEKLMENW